MKSKRAPSAFGSSQRLKRPPSEDCERVKQLLKRLQLIVPEAPKNRRLPQVQVIQHVIDYICDLEEQVVQHLSSKKKTSSVATTQSSVMRADLVEQRNSDDVDGHADVPNSRVHPEASHRSPADADSTVPSPRSDFNSQPSDHEISDDLNSTTDSGIVFGMSTEDTMEHNVTMSSDSGRIPSSCAFRDDSSS